MEPITARKTSREALELDTSSFFYHSTPGSYSCYWEQSSIYSRIECSAILGQPLEVSEEEDKLILHQSTSRCFNCGDTEHKVSACPLPTNRELIALSRQYYQFFHGTLGPQWQRVHTFESRRQQRMDWIEEFQPGEIRGELLQDALAESNEEWLRAICAWGYPPGWISEVDPRNHVRARIWNEYDCDNDSLEVFEIHGEDDVESIPILVNDDGEEGPDREQYDRDVVSDNQNEMMSDKHSLSKSQEPDIIHDSTPMKRWAQYPSRYFSSDLLFPYSPAMPGLPPPSWDNTSFIDTTAYLCQHHPSFSVPPPPPSVSPPPLPPKTPPGVPSLPPIPPSEPYHSLSRVPSVGSESDMEMSDSE